MTCLFFQIFPILLTVYSITKCVSSHFHLKWTVNTNVFHQRMLDRHFSQESLSAFLPAWKDEFPVISTVLVSRYLLLNDLICWGKTAPFVSLSDVILMQVHHTEVQSKLTKIVVLYTAYTVTGQQLRSLENTRQGLWNTLINNYNNVSFYLMHYRARSKTLVKILHDLHRSSSNDH